jgi:hypothetical protein
MWVDGCGGRVAAHEFCQPERVSKACSIAGKISGVTSTNTHPGAPRPVAPAPSSWSTASTSGSRKPAAETPKSARSWRSRILRGAKATFGYGSTLTFLEDIAHVTHAAAKKPLDRARALNPSHQIDGSTIPARAPHRSAEGAIGAGQDRRHHHHHQSHPTTMSEHDRTGAEKTLVDLARDAGPRENGHAGTRPPDTLNPDGPEPKDPARSNPHGSCTSRNTATSPPP